MKQALRLLMIEDSEDDAFLLLRELRSLGEVACTRVESEQQLRRAMRQGGWDLAVSDYMLPGFNGLQALKIVRQHQAELPFIIVSGTIGEDIAVEAMRAGAHDYIMKNNLTRLLPAVERELREMAVRRQRQSAELAYRRMEERFLQLVRNIDQVFWMRDEQHEKFLYVSSAIEQIWGISCETLLKAPGRYQDAVHEEDRERVRQAVSRAAKGAYQIEYRIVRPDGQIRWIRDRAFPALDDMGRLMSIGGVAEDITKLKQDEEIKMSLEAQLRQTQKMEAIGTLAGGIAHDFNNILGAIMGYVELAADNLEAGHPAVEDLQQVTQATERARALVGQILTYSRKQEQALRPLQIENVIREALRLLRATLPASIEINQTLRAPLPPVLADGTQIHQIIMNLATNASQAMQQTAGVREGVLEVSLRETTLDQQAAGNHPDLNPGRHVLLEVGDNGCGMTPEILERIYDPFFSTKGPGEGTGMGLSVVHGIVRHHGGAILARSTLGKGTTFSVYLPAIDREEEVPDSARDHIPSGQGERILFVDDEPPLVKLGSRILEKLGYQVTGHAHSLEAWSDFRDRPGHFDVVVSDLTMPKLSGIELAGKLWELRPDIPILIVTGFSDSIDQEAARELGISEVVMKPYTSQILARALRAGLARKERMPPGSPPTPSPAGTGRVIILDDDRPFTEMLVARACKAGYETRGFCRSTDALRSFSEDPADLLLLDIIMPDKEGLECIGEFRALKPDLKIIAISGGGMNNPAEYLMLARKLGADEAFAKPLRTADLLDHIARLLRGHASVSGR